MFGVSISLRTFHLTVLIFALHCLSLSSSSAFAWGPDRDKSQISIEKKYVGISVTVDKELEPFTKLFASCLAEGKVWANKRNEDAAAERRDNRETFHDGRSWAFDREYILRSVVGRYISVARLDMWFGGGAHPDQDIDTILWDDAARKRISIRPFFTETVDNGPTMTTLAQLAKLAVAAAKLAKGIGGPAANEMTPEQELQGDTSINDGIKPAILKIGPITLAPSTESGKSSGLTFHYSPYRVSGYRDGPYTVFVPWTKFRQYLSPQGAALFGGERPQGDKDDKERW